MLTYIIVLVVGFVAGALVFRNNSAKAEAVVQGGKKAGEAVNKVLESTRKR